VALGVRSAASLAGVLCLGNGGCLVGRVAEVAARAAAARLEARRVAAAVVRGCTDVLLNALHPRMHYENGEFWVPATREVTDELGGRRLVLVPTIAGLSGRVGIGLPDVFYIAYPVPGQAGLGEHGTTVMDPDGDPLCRMLGGMRAHVLRTANGPVSMGQLAAALGCSPRVTSCHWRPPRGHWPHLA
jgi:hypothetical protein